VVVDAALLQSVPGGPWSSTPILPQDIERRDLVVKALSGKIERSVANMQRQSPVCPFVYLSKAFEYIASITVELV